MHVDVSIPHWGYLPSRPVRDTHQSERPQIATTPRVHPGFGLRQCWKWVLLSLLLISWFQGQKMPQRGDLDKGQISLGIPLLTFRPEVPKELRDVFERVEGVIDSLTRKLNALGAITSLIPCLGDETQDQGKVLNLLLTAFQDLIDAFTNYFREFLASARDNLKIIVELTLDNIGGQDERANCINRSSFGDPPQDHKRHLMSPSPAALSRLLVAGSPIGASAALGMDLVRGIGPQTNYRDAINALTSRPVLFSDFMKPASQVTSVLLQHLQALGFSNAPCSLYLMYLQLDNGLEHIDRLADLYSKSKGKDSPISARRRKQRRDAERPKFFNFLDFASLCEQREEGLDCMWPSSMVAPESWLKCYGNNLPAIFNHNPSSNEAPIRLERREHFCKGLIKPRKATTSKSCEIGVCATLATLTTAMFVVQYVPLASQIAAPLDQLRQTFFKAFQVVKTAFNMRRVIKRQLHKMKRELEGIKQRAGIGTGSILVIAGLLAAQDLVILVGAGIFLLKIGAEIDRPRSYQILAASLIIASTLLALSGPRNIRTGFGEIHIRKAQFFEIMLRVASAVGWLRAKSGDTEYITLMYWLTWVTLLAVTFYSTMRRNVLWVPQLSCLIIKPINLSLEETSDEISSLVETIPCLNLLLDLVEQLAEKLGNSPEIVEALTWLNAPTLLKLPECINSPRYSKLSSDMLIHLFVHLTWITGFVSGVSVRRGLAVITVAGLSRIVFPYRLSIPWDPGGYILELESPTAQLELMLACTALFCTTGNSHAKLRGGLDSVEHSHRIAVEEDSKSRHRTDYALCELATSGVANPEDSINRSIH